VSGDAAGTRSVVELWRPEPGGGQGVEADIEALGELLRAVVHEGAGVMYKELEPA
jgi:hypothetical protein